MPHVRLALEGLRDSTEAVFGTGHRRLTFSASQTIIDHWLLPRLGRLQTLTKAEISIQSMVTGTHDAPQDDVIRIRYGTGDWPHRYRARLYAEEIAPWQRPLWQPAPSIGQCCHAFLAPVSGPVGMPGQQRSAYRPPHCPPCALTRICLHLARPGQGWAFVWHRCLCARRPWKRERWYALTASLFLITKVIGYSRALKRCRAASGGRLQQQSLISD